MNQPFVAVHVGKELNNDHIVTVLMEDITPGAGFHSDANSKELKALCRKACIEVVPPLVSSSCLVDCYGSPPQAMAALKDGVSSDQAVVRAISVLEVRTCVCVSMMVDTAWP